MAVMIIVAMIAVMILVTRINKNIIPKIISTISIIINDVSPRSPLKLSMIS